MIKFQSFDYKLQLRCYTVILNHLPLDCFYTYSIEDPDSVLFLVCLHVCVQQTL